MSKTRWMILWTLVPTLMLGTFVHQRAPVVGGTAAAIPMDGAPMAATVLPPMAPSRVEPEPEARGEDGPAWMRDPAAPAETHAAALTRSSAASARQREAVNAAMLRLQKLQAQGQADPQALAQALEELERANGSSEMQGIRLDALRDNLRVAQRMQLLAQDVQALQQTPVSEPERKAEQQAELARKLGDMQALQREIRSDVLVRDATTSRRP